MKQTKKLLAMLLAVCMLVPLFGLSALAVDKMTNDPGSTKQWGMKAVGMEEAWRSGLTGKGVKVGVIDCGLSTATGDIARSRVEAGPNYTGSIGDSATDIEGHGTFVAGTGAVELRDEDVAGVEGSYIILLIKGGVGGEEVTFLNIRYMFLAVEVNTVLGNALDTLLDGTVHLGVGRTGDLLGSDLLDREEVGVVIDGVLLYLLKSRLEAFVAVPPNIVMACSVVVLHIGPLGLLRGAGG